MCRGKTKNKERVNKFLKLSGWSGGFHIINLFTPSEIVMGHFPEIAKESEIVNVDSKEKLPHQFYHHFRVIDDELR
jgi:hypothetical protein